MSADQIISPVNTTCETRLRSERESEEFELSKLFDEQIDTENANSTASNSTANSNTTNNNLNDTATKVMCH